MPKIDLKRELKHLYAPSSSTVEIVDVPQFSLVMIDGRIEPGQTPEMSVEFQEAMGALNGAAYTLKFMSKLSKSNPIDYTVMALEGLWWTDSGEFHLDRVEHWNWTMMVVQPEHITSELFQESLSQLRLKRDNPAIAKLRFETFQEGICMQIMHVGPYTEEPRTIAKMTAFAEEKGYKLRGKHHEIYLGDPRRAKPERLKTILRHPVEMSD